MHLSKTTAETDYILEHLYLHLRFPHGTAGLEVLKSITDNLNCCSKYRKCMFVKWLNMWVCAFVCSLQQAYNNKKPVNMSQ